MRVPAISPLSWIVKNSVSGMVGRPLASQGPMQFFVIQQERYGEDRSGIVLWSEMPFSCCLVLCLPSGQRLLLLQKLTGLTSSYYLGLWYTLLRHFTIPIVARTYCK